MVYSTVCLRNISYNKYAIAYNFSESELLSGLMCTHMNYIIKERKLEKSFFISIFNYTNKTIAFIKNKYHSSDVGGV